MKSSLIISTYNWPEALTLVLKSAMNQSALPDEIIIADDGSTKETKLLIQDFFADISLPIYHIWHEDNGFRKAAILNKAIEKAQYDYIIQVDGDCIMHPHFIKDHLASAQLGTYLFGARVNIQQSKLEALFQKQLVEFSFFDRGIKKRFRSVYLPFLNRLDKRKHNVSPKFRGCNCSYWRQDAININGYNEDFKGWGREDSEFIIRLHNNGILGKRLKFNGIVHHIFHPEKSHNRLEINGSIEDESVRNKVTICQNGIKKQ
ncbi:MAG: glycosyl transferase [Planctomycetota bacterium]|nr:MAG: glycosyl transferase [Planctomycetota bacterium]